MRHRYSAEFTGKLVGVAGCEASVAPAGVGGRLEARVTCGVELNVSISINKIYLTERTGLIL